MRPSRRTVSRVLVGFFLLAAVGLAVCSKQLRTSYHLSTIEAANAARTIVRPQSLKEWASMQGWRWMAYGRKWQSPQKIAKSVGESWNALEELGFFQERDFVVLADMLGGIRNSNDRYFRRNTLVQPFEITHPIAYKLIRSTNETTIVRVTASEADMLVWEKHIERMNERFSQRDPSSGPGYILPPTGAR